MLAYPIKLIPDTNGTLLVEFPDVPEAITFGEDEIDAVARAAEALEAAFSIYIDMGRELPEPSKRKRNSRLVALPAVSEAKVRLYTAMRRARISSTELARRLEWKQSEVERLLDLNRPAKLDQLEAAFRALNKRISIQIQDAA